LAREFRRVVNVAGAGSHLRVLLRSFSGLVPAAARFSIDDVLPQERAALHDEYAAIHAGDVAAAGDASLAHLRLTADNAVRALRCRGVFTDDAPDGPQWTDVRQILAER
jgi:hypothetical protein